MAAPSQLVGQILGRYRILEQIGAGGMGVVYRAHGERLDRDIALNVLPSGALADEAPRKRFRTEALALSRLNHPNIAMVFDFDTQDGMDFLGTEYIPGTTLDASVGPGLLPEKQVVRLGLQRAWLNQFRRLRVRSEAGGHSRHFVPRVCSDLLALPESIGWRVDCGRLWGLPKRIPPRLAVGDIFNV